MGQKAEFLKAIEASPLDFELRMIYADWLEENDEPEEATRQRKYQSSYEWMKSFASEHFRWAEPHHYTAEEMIEAIKDYVEIGDYFNQDGHTSLKDLDIGDMQEVYNHFEVLTGIKVIESKRDENPFSCSC